MNALFGRAVNFIIVSAALFFAVAAFPSTNALADTTQLTVIHGSNAHGHLFPCPT